MRQSPLHDLIDATVTRPPAEPVQVEGREHSDLYRLFDGWDAAEMAANHQGLAKAGTAEDERWIQTGELLPALESDEIVSFWGVEHTVPGLMDWLASLASSLGLRGRDVTVNAFATAARAGYAPHLDPYELIVVQLGGHKTWSLAPEPEVRSPLHSYRLGGADQLVPGYLEPAAARQAMPDPTRVVELRTGSILTLPRGWWHQTTAGSASWSLSITVATPSWAGLILEVLGGHFVTDASWREPVHDLMSDTALADALSVRLDRLTRRLANIDSDALLAELRRA